jgi:hypothetical protein
MRSIQTPNLIMGFTLCMSCKELIARVIEEKVEEVNEVEPRTEL